jgi:Protein of unknown function (DUF4238)
MAQIKKKQHYVWKEYLLSWSSKNQICALFKSSNKIIKTNIEGVAQERYFYALEEFTEEEEIILKELISLWSNDVVRPFVMEFYNMITSFSKISRAIKNKDLSGINTTELDKKLALLKANTMEDMHTSFENFGKKLIEIRKVEDLMFLDDERELLFAMIYVSFQYLRTKNMREVVKPIIEKYPYLSDKFLNFFPFIYAPGIADSLTYGKKIKFIFLDNKTEVNFITTDQPIINAKKHIISDNGNVAQLDYYYPITPKIAIIIHYQEQKEKRKYMLIEKEQVNHYNDLMIRNAKEFIFSNTEEQLKSNLNSH